MFNKKNHSFIPHRHKGRFYNHANEHRYPFMLHTMSMLYEVCWRSIDWAAQKTPLLHAPVELIKRSVDPLISWIGHSTFLIQAGGINIITDPVFGNLGPFFKRLNDPGIALAAVPEIDYVLISHNHRDHMDSAALHYFKKHPRTHFLVPQGDKAWFDRRGFKRVYEYNWWEQQRFNHEDSSITCSFLPAHHWSARGLFDFNKSLWGSWMISINDKHIYFAGDTAYSDHFSVIAKEFPSISCALMPIGPCEPHSWMSHSHVNAEEAGQAFLDLQAQHFIPMHWGTYAFGTDQHFAPYERLVSWWQKQKFADKKLIALKLGERFALPTQLVVPEYAPLVEPQTEQIL